MGVKCRVCHRPAESVDYCCDRCLDAPLWRLFARHPLRCVAIGWLHALGIIE
jgi:hypothetical protein